jgi:succinate dehydrogenase/fumarate reductase flavoprotein subunit
MTAEVRVLERYEVIVIGAGTAGIPCALEASAREGARVLILEKDELIGGTLHLSSGQMSAAGTRRQRARGIQDSAAAHRADIDRLSSGTARADIVDRAVTLASSTIDWLDDHGFDFSDESPYKPSAHEPYSVARSYEGREGGMSVLRILKKLLECRVGEGRIEIRLSTPVTGLRTNDAGNVVGVTVCGTEGNEDIDADAVVLATGGFASDPKLFRELEGVPLMSCARPTSTGDGLILALAVGGTVSGQGTYMPTFGGLPHPETPHRSLLQPRPLLLLADREPWEIYVDRHGRRFVAEDAPGPHAKEVALLGTDDLTFWMIFDGSALQRSTAMIEGWTGSDIDELAGSRTGVHRADDLAALAGEAGIDADGLIASVAAYNAALRDGSADDLGRTHRPAEIATGPFYALRNHGISVVTFAGLDVDADMCVRRTDGSIIGGLYAIGEIIGNGATAGRAFCSGMQVTPALSFGRWLGRELSERRVAAS